MRSKSVGISTGLHIAIFLIASVSLPWLKKDFTPPPPISVELAEIAKVTETPKIAPKPEEKKDDEQPPAPPKPAPAPQNTSQEAVVPVKEDKKEPVKELKKDEVLVDKNAPPEKKLDKKEEKKKKVEDAKPKRDFASVLKNLEDRKDAKPEKKTQPDLKADAKPATTKGQNAPLGAKLTMSEEEALRRQLEQCWNVPYGAKDIETMSVDIVMTINADRTLGAARIADMDRYNSDSFFRALADSAMRAVKSPLCSPFQLPPDKYETWKTTTVTFNPSEMF